jgi:hypothetical protein
MFRLFRTHPAPDIGDVKRLTREQVESRKEKAVRFTDNVLGDSDRADEIADESLESYAERKGIEITNPHKRRITVARTRTRAELEAEIEELQQENEDLQEQLDAVADIVSPTDEDEDEGDEGEDNDH